MRSVLYLLTILAVMGMAFWAYRENYSTQAALNEMGKVQHEIATLREDLGVLRAEWSYLNRPARLRALVNLNFDRLRLMPFDSSQFVDVEQVAYPVARAVLADPAAGPVPAAADPALADAAPGAQAVPAIRPAGYPPLRPQPRTP